MRLGGEILGSSIYKQWPSFGTKICSYICQLDIICSEKWTVLREQSSRKTVSFEEQIMSKDKYLSIFLKPNWGYCVYYPSVLQIFSFSWGIFTQVMRLDQSHTSENIWWIISMHKHYHSIFRVPQTTPPVCLQCSTSFFIPFSSDVPRNASLSDLRFWHANVQRVSCKLFLAICLNSPHFLSNHIKKPLLIYTHQLKWYNTALC